MYCSGDSIGPPDQAATALALISNTISMVFSNLTLLVSLSTIQSEMADLKKKLSEVENEIKNVPRAEGIDDNFMTIMPVSIDIISPSLPRSESVQED
jgi:hypothetical protein